MNAPATGIEHVRKDIFERLTSDPNLKLVKIFRGQLVNGEAAPVDADGMVNLYVVVIFGGKGRVQRSWQGITSSRDDLRRLTFGIEIYARDTVTKDIVADYVADRLEGYEPAGEGEITEFYSGQIENPIELVGNQVREGIGKIFECTVNSSVDEESYTPAPTPNGDSWITPTPNLPGYYDAYTLPTGFDMLKD